MIRWWSLLLVIVLTLGILYKPAYAATKSSEFTQQGLEQLKQKYLGKRWLMLLWSVDCPPCFKELALIKKLSQKQSELAVVIVNADDNDELIKERADIIESFELASFRNFHFAEGLGDKSRYLIDPSWYGELPRSYFVDKSGKFHGKSGLVKEELLTNWLINK